jgi:hypothetical protein
MSMAAIIPGDRRTGNGDAAEGVSGRDSTKHNIYGAICEKWQAMDADLGALGQPVSSEMDGCNGRKQAPSSKMARSFSAGWRTLSTAGSANYITTWTVSAVGWVRPWR